MQKKKNINLVPYFIWFHTLKWVTHTHTHSYAIFFRNLFLLRKERRKKWNSKCQAENLLLLFFDGRTGELADWPMFNFIIMIYLCVIHNVGTVHNINFLLLLTNINSKWSWRSVLLIRITTKTNDCEMLSELLLHRRRLS